MSRAIVFYIYKEQSVGRTMQRKHRGGRPKRKISPGERVPLGLRVTPSLKSVLDKAAERSGRSQSQEAELRLERTFRDQSLLPDALELAYGRQLAGLLMILARAMKDGGQ